MRSSRAPSIRVTLLQDNLGTHKPNSFYEAFSPEEVKRARKGFETYEGFDTAERHKIGEKNAQSLFPRLRPA
jgi:hypothetical protein